MNLHPFRANIHVVLFFDGDGVLGLQVPVPLLQLLSHAVQRSKGRRIAQASLGRSLASAGVVADGVHAGDGE